jgi:hypothetical protein
VKPAGYNITLDESGVGPDHTSFYLKDIPVLFFFTERKIIINQVMTVIK